LQRHHGVFAISSNELKSSLRSELRNRRSNLSAPKRARYDEAIRQHLLQFVESRQAVSIACYWPFNGEPDITPLYKQWIADGCELALPVVSGNDDHAMKFHAWGPNTRLAANRYGILEPVESEITPLSSFDLLIMPLVAYDRYGNRLGMGSGYYDRHLESLRGSETPFRLSIAYSLQEVDPIDKNDWDIPLHGVVNERGWFTFVE
jgi:5-formyltetrahydrofolate cyclo-ligase